MHSKRIILLAVILLVLLPEMVNAKGKDNVFAGSWVSSSALPPQIASLLEGREGYCLSSGGTGNRIFMTHGLASGSGDSADVRAYDIDTDTWISLAPTVISATPRSEGAGVSHAGLLYCIGGRFGTVLGAVDVYNTVTNVLSSVSPMATPRAGLAAAVVGNQIYAIGGRAATGGPCSGPALNVAEVYDIATDTWTPAPPPLIPVTDAEAVSHGGKIFLIGGCGTAPFTPLNPSPLQIFDPASGQWVLGMPMPTPRASLAAGVLGNTIYAIGGIDAFGNLSVVEAYDIDKGVWSSTAITPKPTASSEAHAARHGRRLYVPGSGSFGAASAVFEAFERK